MGSLLLHLRNMMFSQFSGGGFQLDTKRLFMADNAKLTVEAIKPDKPRVTYAGWDWTMVIRTALRSRRLLFFPSAQAGEAARLGLGTSFVICAAARLG
jgi:hypothetical protein